MNDLPSGWAWTTLGEIGDYLNGRGFKQSEWREVGRPIIRIQNLTGSRKHFNYFDGEVEDRYVARPGDLLVSWAATLGVFVWDGPEAVINQHIFKVASRIDPAFHRYLLLATLDALKRQAHGSGMVHITKPAFVSTAVALPPLNEQLRIVAAIEEQFSRLDAAERSLKVARLRLPSFRASLFETAASGRLSRRPHEHDRPTQWDEVAIGELATETLIGLDRPRSVQSGDPTAGCAYVRMQNITNEGEMIWDHLTFVAVSDAERQRFSVKEGDLLFNTRNSRELVGKVGLVRQTPHDAVYNNNLMRIRLVDDVDPAFLWIVMCSPSFRRELDRIKSATTNVAAIYAKNLLPLRVPVPPFAEQTQIVDEVDRQLSLTPSLSTATQMALGRGASLRRSILSQGFTGNLVAQDPSDEPASVLLERIASERGPVPKPSRRKRTISA